MKEFRIGIHTQRRMLLRNLTDCVRIEWHVAVTEIRAHLYEAFLRSK